MVSYTKGVKLELLPELDNLRPYIEENKMYIRLASTDMFKVSKSVVQGIIKGELKTPQEALAAFNEQMNADPAQESVVVHLDKGYSHEFSSKHGNHAASDLTEQLRGSQEPADPQLVEKIREYYAEVQENILKL